MSSSRYTRLIARAFLGLIAFVVCAIPGTLLLWSLQGGGHLNLSLGTFLLGGLVGVIAEIGLFGFILSIAWAMDHA